MAAPATAAISSRSVLCALISTPSRGGVGEREIGAVAGASVCDWALLTRSRLFRGVDIMSGRSGRARARDARPEGRDPQPQPTATRSEASMAESAWLLARQGSPVAKRCAIIISIITNTTALPKNAAVLQLETVLAVKMAVGWRVRPSRGERQRARGPARPWASPGVWSGGWSPGPGAIKRQRRSRPAEGGRASARRPRRGGQRAKASMAASLPLRGGRASSTTPRAMRVARACQQGAGVPDRKRSSAAMIAGTGGRAGASEASTRPGKAASVIRVLVPACGAGPVERARPREKRGARSPAGRMAGDARRQAPGLSPNSSR